MSGFDQILGVLVGGLLTLLTTVLTQFLEQRKQKQKAILENQKFDLQTHLKYEIAKQRRKDKEKEGNIKLIKNYSQLEVKPLFNGVDFSDAKLSGLDLRGVQLKGANLTGVEMRYCCLANSDLEGATCKNAVFEGSNFQNANLNFANFSSSNLRNTRLLGASTQGLNLEKAILTESQYGNDINTAGSI